MKHTDLPWSTNGTFVWITSNNAEIGKRGEELAFVPAGENSFEREANAAYIVKCCNTFPELLEALKGTLYLFEAHAVSKTDLEQIAFAQAIIKRAES